MNFCATRRKARRGLPSLPPRPMATKTSVFVVGIFGALERLGLAEGELFVVVDAFGRRVVGLAACDILVLAVAVEDVRVSELVALGAARGVKDDGRRRLRGRVLLIRTALRTVDGRFPEVVELRPTLEARMFVSEIRQCASKTGPEHSIRVFQGQRARGPYTEARMPAIPPPPRKTAAFACAAALLFAGAARAQMPFTPFGGRSVALGGASVGLGPDVAAGIDNPAAVPDRDFAFTVSAGLLTRENGDFLAPLRLIPGNNPLSLASGAQSRSYADVLAALHTLADPANGLLGNGSVGLALSHDGWELSFTDWGYSGVSARVDLAHTELGSNPASSIAFNTSAAAFRGLELKDLALAKSVSFFLGRFTVGAAVHALWGTTYTKEEPVFTMDVSDPFNLAQRAQTGTGRSHTDWSFDLGGLMSLGPVNVGAVWKALNKPTFPFADDGPVADRGRSVTYGQQARVGASVKIPVVGLVVAADYDLTVNETLVDGLRVRQAGGGVEWTIFLVAVRAGASLNLESSERTPTFTGGAGVVIGPAKVDLGGWYRTDKSALGVSVTARAGL